MTLLFVNKLLDSLDTIWHSRWLPKKNDFIVLFSYINISMRFLMSEICFNCNECLFLIYNMYM